jgi:hypothetical protein
LDGLIAAAEAIGCRPQLLETIAEFNRHVRAQAEAEHSNTNGAPQETSNGNPSPAGLLELALVDESHGLDIRDPVGGPPRGSRS